MQLVFRRQRRSRSLIPCNNTPDLALGGQPFHRECFLGELQRKVEHGVGTALKPFHYGDSNLVPAGAAMWTPKPSTVWILPVNTNLTPAKQQIWTTASDAMYRSMCTTTSICLNSGGGAGASGAGGEGSIFAGMSSSPVLTILSLMPSRINPAGMELQSSLLGPSSHDQHLGLGLGLGGEGHMGIYASPLNSYTPGRSQLNHYFEHTQNPIQIQIRIQSTKKTTTTMNNQANSTTAINSYKEWILSYPRL